MAREPVSKEQIHRAAEQLKEAGQKVTLESVRDAVGGGSYTTISKALRAWREQQQAAPLPHDPLPELLKDQIQSFGSAVWGAALELAQSRLQAEREALTAARLQLEMERNEATELADGLSHKVERLQARLDEVEQERAAQRAQLEEAQRELIRVGERERAAQGRVGELAGRVEELKGELEQATAVAAAREAVQGELAALRAQLDEQEGLIRSALSGKRKENG